MTIHTTPSPTRGPSETPAVVPLPSSFTIEIDPDTRRIGGDRVLGGHPARLVRLQPGVGTDAFAEIEAGRLDSHAARVLGRRLTDHGMAHPIPKAAAETPPVDVVVPAHDRIELLAATLESLQHTCASIVVVDDGSDDAHAVAGLARRVGASLVRHDTAQGPAGARNAGLRAARTELVALVDSDCTVPPGWLDELAAHFADPLVGAVAPRVRTAPPATSAPNRYCDANGPIDMAARPGRVAPGTRIPFVPTAALVVRRAALDAIGGNGDPFDVDLRYGEDVDLVWRLHAAGWRVRYVPSVEVLHHEPDSWVAIWRRRFRYGTSAAPLARRHPDAFVAIVVAPWPAAVVISLVAGSPIVAAGCFAIQVGSLAVTMRRIGIPVSEACPTAWRSTRSTFRGIGTFLTQLAAPLLVAGACTGAGGRLSPVGRATLAALVVGPLAGGYRTSRPRLDPLGFSIARLIDEISYGAGVLAGCVSERTIGPVKPRLFGRPAISPSSARRAIVRSIEQAPARLCARARTAAGSRAVPDATRTA